MMDLNAVKTLMSEKTLLTISDIKTLTGCSDSEARKMRIEALKTYLPIDDSQRLKTKVRIDKFLDYYDNKYLIEMYKEILNTAS